MESIVESGPAEVKVGKLMQDLGCDLESLCAMMPLTTTVNVEKPEHVIGFAWVHLDNPVDVKIVTFPDREWETTAQYTGMTKDLYEQSMLSGPTEDEYVMRVMTSPLFAYAGGILRKSLKMADIEPVVIELPNAVRRVSGAGVLVPRKFLATPFLFVKWLNSGVPLRKMKRADLATNTGVKWEDRSTISVIGRNLAIDAALAKHVLDANIEISFDEEG